MALNFDSAGSNRNVNHGSGATLDNLHNSAFTAWFWVNRTSDGDNQFIYSKDNTGTVGHIGFVDNAPGEGGLGFLVQRATTDAACTTTAATGLTTTATNYFIAFVYDPSAAQHCRVFRGSRTLPVAECSYASTTNGSGAAVSDAAANLRVGNYDASLTLPFRGTISRGGFVARALTAPVLQWLAIQSASDITACNLADTKLLFDYTDTSSVTDHSGNSNNGTVTGATDATHVPLASNKAVTDSNIFFSPYNWYSDGAGGLQANNIKGSSTYALANTPGAYLKFRVNVPTGPSALVTVSFDVSSLSGLAAADCPVIGLSVDGSGWARGQLAHNADGKVAVPVTTLLASGDHTIEVMFTAIGFGSATDRWSTPANAIKVTGVHMDTTNLDLTTNVVQSKNILAFGASTFEGYASFASGTGQANHDASIVAPRILAKVLGAELGNVAFSGIGFETGILGAAASATNPSFYNTTAANQAWDKYFSGQSRLVGGLFAPQPDYILIQLGLNDASLTAADVAAAVSAVQTAAPDAFIYVISHSQNALPVLAQGVALMDDTRKVVAVTPQVILTPSTATEYSFDGTHLSYRGHPLLAAEILKQTRNTGPSMARVVNR